VKDALELAAVEDQQPVKAFATDAADPALRVGVRAPRPRGLRMMVTPSLVTTKSNLWLNLMSRSCIR
jgi:hypothetical protein